MPVDLPEAAQGLELLVAQLDARGADDAGVEAHGVADLVLDPGGGVVAHDEVVAVVVELLVARDGARQREHAPVVDGPDHAALPEDELARGEDDSVVFRELAAWVETCGPWLRKELGGGGRLVVEGRVLFHLCEAARSDLWEIHRQHKW